MQQITDGYNVNVNIDYALTIDQTLRFGAGYNQQRQPQPGYRPVATKSERAYTRDSDNGFVRLQQIGPLGRRAFLRTRFQLLVDAIPTRAPGRGADHSRHRRFHERRRAGRRRPARQDRSSDPISITCAAITPCGPASSSMRRAGAPTISPTISAPTPSKASRRSTPARRATTRVASATRTSLQLRAGRDLQQHLN